MMTWRTSRESLKHTKIKTLRSNIVLVFSLFVHLFEIVFATACDDDDDDDDDVREAKES